MRSNVISVDLIMYNEMFFIREIYKHYYKNNIAMKKYRVHTSAHDTT